jgi:hypothetical protein
MEKWGFELEERYLYAAPLAGAVRRAGGGEEADGAAGGAPELPSGVPIPLTVSFSDPWPQPPDGLAVFGAVRFLDRNAAGRAPGDAASALVLEVPLELAP